MNKLKRKINNLPLAIYVTFSITFVIIYTIAEFIVSTRSGVSHDVLTECVYKFFVGEVVVCGLIKIFKLLPSPKDTIKQKLENSLGYEIGDVYIDDDR